MKLKTLAAMGLGPAMVIGLLTHVVIADQPNTGEISPALPLTAGTDGQSTQETGMMVAGDTSKTKARASASASASSSARTKADGSGECVATSDAKAEATADGETIRDSDGDRKVGKDGSCSASAEARASASSGDKRKE